MTPSSNLSNKTIKIVVDTNLYLSVFVFRGQLGKLIFELVINKKLAMYVSPALKKEIKKKFDFFGVSNFIQNEVMDFISSRGILVEPAITIEKSRDIKDNFLLELSEASRVDYLVTRDEDLLVLGKCNNTVIITPEDFLHILRNVGVLE